MRLNDRTPLSWWIACITLTNALIGKILRENTKNHNNIPLSQVTKTTPMSQRLWTKIVSQCGTITHPNQKMISSQTKYTNTARVHQPLVVQITDTNHPRSLLMDRVNELVEAARSALSSTPDRAAATDTNTHTTANTTRTTQCQPPLIPSPNIAQAQRLRIAQTEWKKILSQRLPPEFHSPPTNRHTFLSNKNHRENNPWGDILAGKRDNVTRVYSLNTNGLSLDRRGGRFDDLCKIAKEVQADVVCCQEHNLDITKSNVRSILYDTARQYWSRSRLTFESKNYAVPVFDSACVVSLSFEKRKVQARKD
jgi:hypothetical protein